MVVTRDTYIRNLPLSVIRELALRLDRPMASYQDWRGMAGKIPRRPGSNEPKYNAMQISLFEQASSRPGGSPTEAILSDWGTTNARVSDLLRILAEMDHYSAMDALLPGSSEEYLNSLQAEQANENEANPEPTRQTEQRVSEPRVPELRVPDPRVPEPRVPSEPKVQDPPKNTLPVGIGVVQPSPAPTNQTSPSAPPLSGTRVPVQSTEPDSTTSLPYFDPQIVQRFSFEEIANMTRHFDGRKVRDGGSLIDEGGFGVVFKGRFHGDEPCAVKKLKEEHSSVSEDVNIAKQFDAELNALCRLRHANVVMLYGYCYEPPNLCLVYELMTGGALRDRLAAKEPRITPLTWPKRLNIALDCASGIRFLHDKNFIHRDIKSGNILLDSNLVAKIGDLGLVKDKSDKPKGTTSTYRTTIAIGSTAYMAPEAVMGTYSKKTDVYSFGLVLLEILTGLPIHDGTYIIDRVDNEMEIHDNPLRLVDARANPWDATSVRVIYDLYTRCTEQKARRRPDITEISDELSRIQTMAPTM